MTLQLEARRELRVATEIRDGALVQKSVGGKSQRLKAGPLRRFWSIEAVMEGDEISALERLFEQTRGRVGTFEFADPETGDVYPACRFVEDRLRVVETREGEWRVRFTIEEQRS